MHNFDNLDATIAKARQRAALVRTTAANATPIVPAATAIHAEQNPRSRIKRLFKAVLSFIIWAPFAWLLYAIVTRSLTFDDWTFIFEKLGTGTAARTSAFWFQILCAGALAALPTIMALRSYRKN